MTFEEVLMICQLHLVLAFSLFPRYGVQQPGVQRIVVLFEGFFLVELDQLDHRVKLVRLAESEHAILVANLDKFVAASLPQRQCVVAIPA